MLEKEVISSKDRVHVAGKISVGRLSVWLAPAHPDGSAELSTLRLGS